MPIVAGLALDAVYNMIRRYTISRERIYIAGYSAGAQRASWIIRAFPDVFRGAYLMMGGWFYHIDYSYDGWFFEDNLNLEGYAAYVQGLDPQWKGPFDKLKTQV